MSSIMSKYIRYITDVKAALVTVQWSQIAGNCTDMKATLIGLVGG